MYSCLYDGTKINFKRPGVEKSLIMNVSNENKSRKQVTVFNYTWVELVYNCDGFLMFIILPIHILCLIVWLPSWKGVKL